MSIRVSPTGQPGEHWLVLEHGTRALSSGSRAPLRAVLASHQTVRRVRQLAALACRPPQGRGDGHGNSPSAERMDELFAPWLTSRLRRVVRERVESSTDVGLAYA
jgi:hypothetical protein